MALVLADRVQETCTSPGTGTVTLLGAVTGFRTFAAAIGSSNTCYYTIADQTGANWEVGIGTVGSGTLARTTVLASSNSGSLTNFSSGTQNVFVTYPAEVAVSTDNTATLTNKTLTGFTETVYSVSGTTPALSPTNGTIQTWTLSGASTPTAGTWAAGQSLTLRITAGANTITWTSLAVTWIGGSAPTLSTTATTTVELWKISTTIYGANVGNA